MNRWSTRQALAALSIFDLTGQPEAVRLLAANAAGTAKQIAAAAVARSAASSPMWHSGMTFPISTWCATVVASHLIE